jgi:8-oxo-dGTP diphosphatase
MPPLSDRACVFIVRDGRILLMHRVKQGEVYDAVPGGTVESGERPEDTAVREILEETSMVVTLGRRVLLLPNQGRQEYYFDAVTVTGDPILGGPEAVRNSPENVYELVWVAIEEIANRAVRPHALRDWMAKRDWKTFPTE